MAYELKIKLANTAEAEQKLTGAGGVFVEETYFIDSYFNQPQGDVFKISETNKGFSLVSLRAENGKFTIIKDQPLDNVDAVRAEMTGEYGVKVTLKGTRKIYTLGDLKVTLATIDTLGDFLILTGENPTEDVITDKLGIQNPEYIQVSFDTLLPAAVTPPAAPAAPAPPVQQ